MWTPSEAFAVRLAFAFKPSGDKAPHTRNHNGFVNQKQDQFETTRARTGTGDRYAIPDKISHSGRHSIRKIPVFG